MTTSCAPVGIPNTVTADIEPTAPTPSRVQDPFSLGLSAENRLSC
jgi:hypothetical protein